MIAMLGLSQLPRPIAGLIFLLIAVEQFRTDLPFRLDRTAQMSDLAKVSHVPPECRSFYISVPKLKPIGNPGIDTRRTVGNGSSITRTGSISQPGCAP